MSVDLVLCDFLSSVGFFTVALFLTFLERVNLHPVIICNRFIST